MVLLSLVVLAKSSEQTPDKDITWMCEKWQWSGDVFERKIMCIKWIKKDCSNRMYKELCKLGV
jgi:hypothetical protein